MPLAAKVRKFKTELELSAGVWTDVTADVRSNAPIQASYGIFGHGPLDRTAGEGTMSFALDNSEGNSNSAVGYYSPGHASVRTGFELGISVRFTILYGVYYDTELYDVFTYGAHWVKFVGRVTSITVDADPKGPRTTTCEAKDFIYLAGQHKLSLVAVKTDRRSDLLVGDILDDMASVDQPTTRSLSSGQETFAYAMDDLVDEKSTALAAIQKATLSEFGYAYTLGAEDGTGDIFKFEDRHDRVGDPVDYDLSAEPVSHITVDRPLDKVYNRVRTSSYPRKVGVAAERVYNMDHDLEIAAGATQVIEARYVDPDNPDTRVSATSLITPTGTDFEFGSSSGDGNDQLHASLGITMTAGANAASLSLVNNAGVTGYVNKMQIRGTIIRLYEPVLIVANDSSSQTSYGLRETNLVLPYQNNPLVADDFGALVLAFYKNPRNYITEYSIAADKSVALGNVATRAEPGDRVTIPANTPTGVASGDYYVHGVKISAIPPTILLVTWSLVLASAADYWLLGQVSGSELGTQTILGV